MANQKAAIEADTIASAIDQGWQFVASVPAANQNGLEIWQGDKKLFSTAPTSSLTNHAEQVSTSTKYQYESGKVIIYKTLPAAVSPAGSPATGAHASPPPARLSAEHTTAE